MDSGYPFTTEPGLLRTLVHNPSVVQKALTATGIRHGHPQISLPSQATSSLNFSFFQQCELNCRRHSARLVPQVTQPSRPLTSRFVSWQPQALRHPSLYLTLPISATCRGGLKMPVTAATGATCSSNRKSASFCPSLPSSVPCHSIVPHSRKLPCFPCSIYVDIIDFIDCVIDTNGLLASCSVRRTFSELIFVTICQVHGDILCNSKLSGRAPEVLLSFSNISIIDDMSLHPCVKYNR
jgi:hypothetical protein